MIVNFVSLNFTHLFPQALSYLLNATPFSFVIDLAVLASRREYLKLDKWLTDKIREHGEQFIQACVAFLKRRCPTILGKDLIDELRLAEIYLYHVCYCGI